MLEGTTTRAIHVYDAGHAEVLCAQIRALDPSRRVIALTERASLARELPNVRVLFAPMPPRDGWSDARSLELIQMAGAGVSHFLPSPDLPPHVRIAGMRGVFADEAAEHAILMLLALRRDLGQLVDLQRAHRWQQRSVAKLAGRTIAIAGLGAIGSGIARRAAALDVRITGVSRSARPIDHVERVVPLDRQHEAMQGADALIVTLPLTEQTRGVIDARALACLAPGAHVIHLSRGGVIDERALLAALRSGALGGAAIDVFEDEPLDPASPFWDLPRTIITPHVAGCGEHYLERAIEVLLDNVTRLDRGEPLAREIDRAAGY
jgi:phosphoglycerate dehydrogenase-like enzyme